jgi:hypothetical protein
MKKHDKDRFNEEPSKDKDILEFFPGSQLGQVASIATELRIPIDTIPEVEDAVVAYRHEAHRSGMNPDDFESTTRNKYDIGNQLVRFTADDLSGFWRQMNDKKNTPSGLIDNEVDKFGRGDDKRYVSSKTIGGDLDNFGDK